MSLETSERLFSSVSEVKCGVGKKNPSVILIIVLKEREDAAVYGGGVSLTGSGR